MSHQHPHDELDAPGITHTEADEVSETRFGPRPVPEGHRHPSGSPESRHIPPHGDVSPDGRHAYPRPSALAKWVVWGGTGLAAAALTAGTVYAARHIADMISGHDDGKPRRRRAPPPQRREDAPQPRMGFAAPADRMADPAPAPRPRASRASLMDEIEANTASLSHSVEDVMRTVTTAVEGFRGVAGQASAIVREFADAADLVRDIIDRRPPDRGPAAQTGADPDDAGPADHDPRSHRL